MIYIEVGRVFRLPRSKLREGMGKKVTDESLTDDTRSEIRSVYFMCRVLLRLFSETEVP